ncbi:hypothetical protein GCM10017774_25510 [Lentzea cavernae]|uniref:Uncharacterized protein n=1 Tax=Lentzea cavernae TaxID=2020703 RepID=A0ABQ3MBI3_9PSEU|nr:hypothetical protein GCM10017774_25510 [Lentzea cavernae]
MRRSSRLIVEQSRPSSAAIRRIETPSRRRSAITIRSSSFKNLPRGIGAAASVIGGDPAFHLDRGLP